MISTEIPVITYFPIRGRAEPIRLMLEELGVAYQENPVAYRQWVKLKRELPFGKVPMYQEGDLKIFESHAIYRYLARKHGLYGESEIDVINCEILEHVLIDAIEAFGRLSWSKDFKDKRQDFIDGQLTTTLTNLERFLGEIPRGGDYWVGKRLTYIDFLGWNYLDFTRALAGDIINNYPTLKHLKQTFESRPRIAGYLKSDRRPATITVPNAHFGGTPETS
jgi:glutathione S-transferase